MSQNLIRVWRTDRPTDWLTDRLIDIPSYRNAKTHLKIWRIWNRATMTNLVTFWARPRRACRGDGVGLFHRDWTWWKWRCDIEKNRRPDREFGSQFPGRTTPKSLFPPRPSASYHYSKLWRASSGWRCYLEDLFHPRPFPSDGPQGERSLLISFGFFF